MDNENVLKRVAIIAPNSTVVQVQSSQQNNMIGITTKKSATTPTRLDVSWWSQHPLGTAAGVFAVFICVSVIISVLVVCLTATKPSRRTCKLNFRSATTKPIEYHYGSRSVAVADLDNDTYLDMILANRLVNNIAVYMGSGSGTFRSPTSYSTGDHSRPYMITTGHINNDSYLDIVVANFDTNNIGIFYGFGNGSFANQINLPTGSSHPIVVICGHFNNDTLTDFATVNYGQHSISIRYQYHNEGFSSPVMYATGYDSFPSSLAVGDLNNDQYLDLVIANYGTDNIMVLFGSSNGVFIEHTAFSTGVDSRPCAIVVGYFNTDSYLDVAVAHFGTRQVGVLLNQGDGTFTNQMTYSTGSASAFAIAAGDANEDQRSDIIITNQGSDNIGVLLGYGNGNFANPAFFSTGSSSSVSFAMGDFNQDHQLDFVVVNNDTDDVDILFGRFEGFYIHESLTINHNVEAFVVGDFNGDTRSDIGAVGLEKGEVSIFLGSGNGTMQYKTKYSIGLSLQWIDAADFDNDNQLDIVLVHGYTQTTAVALLRGYGNGSFGDQIMSYIEMTVSSVAFGDFNNDHHLDIVAIGSTGNRQGVSIFSGDGYGSFAAQTLFDLETNDFGYAIAVADIDNDTRLDIIVTSSNYSWVNVFFGKGHGSFGNKTTSFLGSLLYLDSIVLVDFNSDHQPDVTVFDWFNNRVTVLLGYSNGSFEHRRTYSVTGIVNSLEVADFNNDGRVDIVVCHAGGVSILLGDGHGSFEETIVTNNSYVQAVAVADFNNDTRLDIISADEDTLTVILQYNTVSLELEMSLAPGGGSSLRYMLMDGMDNDTHLDLIVANYGTSNIGILFGYGNGSFEQQIILSRTVTSRPVSIAVGDFNGDRYIDIAVASDETTEIDLLLGNGKRMFASQKSYGVNFEFVPFVMITGDFDNDERSEIIVVDGQSDRLIIYSAYNKGLFTDEIRYATKFIEPSIALLDWNNSGRLDIVVTSSNSESDVCVLFGNGDGSFENLTVYSVSNRPRVAVVGDFNNDHQLDIVVCKEGNCNLTILIGSGNGSFVNRLAFTLDFSPKSMTAADVNKDTWLDLVLIDQTHNGVSVLLGYGNGSFTNPTKYTVGNNASYIIIADLNNDKQSDIVVNNIRDISVLLGFGDGSFQNRTISSFNFTVHVINVGDFNNDTRLDIVAVALYLSKVSVKVLLGFGNGSFGNAITSSIDETPVSLAVGDFNGDGRLDSVVINPVNSRIGVLYGLGDGSFQKQIIYYSVGLYPSSVAVGDLNHDSRLDLVVATLLGDMSVLLGQDNFVFTEQMTVVTRNGSRPESLVLTDFNNDNLLDIGVASSHSPTVEILRGYGNMSFADELVHVITPHLSPCSIAAGDFNQDTRQDIVVASCDSGSVGIHLGHGNGSFQSPMMYETKSSSSRYFLSVRDINSDTAQDVIVVNYDANTLEVLLGYGNGTFQSFVSFPLERGSNPFSITIGDLNGDRKPDFAVANSGTDSLSILLQTC